MHACVHFVCATLCMLMCVHVQVRLCNVQGIPSGHASKDDPLVLQTSYRCGSPGGRFLAEAFGCGTAWWLQSVFAAMLLADAPMDPTLRRMYGHGGSLCISSLLGKSAPH